MICDSPIPSAATSHVAPQFPLRIRWMRPSDVPGVIRLEHATFEHPWNSRDFAILIQDGTAMVAERGRELLGYMAWERRHTRFQLTNLAVEYTTRRSGIGRALVERLIQVTKASGRGALRCEVRESALDAHLFFRAMEFRCLNVLRDYYDQPSCDPAEDAYVFCRKIDHAQS